MNRVWTKFIEKCNNFFSFDNSMSSTVQFQQKYAIGGHAWLLPTVYATMWATATSLKNHTKKSLLRGNIISFWLLIM